MIREHLYIKTVSRKKAGSTKLVSRPFQKDNGQSYDQISTKSELSYELRFAVCLGKKCSDTFYIFIRKSAEAISEVL